MKVTDRIIFATGNADKMREIREIMEGTGIEAVSMAEAGFSSCEEETGNTFEENALIKARDIWKRSGGIVLGDDSGLEVDFLGGAPGIYSARYMGRDTSYHEKNAEIVKRMEGVPDEMRTARFVCALAAIFPDGEEICIRETMEGRIGYQEAGINGFGYDPIFFLPECKKTSAELSPAEKNALSHRGKALRRMKDIIRTKTCSENAGEGG